MEFICSAQLKNVMLCVYDDGDDVIVIQRDAKDDHLKLQGVGVLSRDEFEEAVAYGLNITFAKKAEAAKKSAEENAPDTNTLASDQN